MEWWIENSAVQIARAFNYNEVCTLACCCFKYVHNRFCASSTTTIIWCAMLHSTCIYCRMSDSLRSEETNITYKCVVTEYESWSSLKQSFLLYLIIIIIGMMVDLMVWVKMTLPDHCFTVTLGYLILGMILTKCHLHMDTSYGGIGPQWQGYVWSI